MITLSALLSPVHSMWLILGSGFPPVLSNSVAWRCAMSGFLLSFFALIAASYVIQSCACIMSCGSFAYSFPSAAYLLTSWNRFLPYTCFPLPIML